MTAWRRGTISLLQPNYQLDGRKGAYPLNNSESHHF